jgi:hypothetical protein
MSHVVADYESEIEVEVSAFRTESHVIGDQFDTDYEDFQVDSIRFMGKDYTRSEFVGKYGLQALTAIEADLFKSCNELEWE